MPRGRRASSAAATQARGKMEEASGKRRRREIVAEVPHRRDGGPEAGGEAQQFAAAKWTVGQIQAMPDKGRGILVSDETETHEDKFGVVDAPDQGEVAR
jgi:hypothetical protein